MPSTSCNSQSEVEALPAKSLPKHPLRPLAGGEGIADPLTRRMGFECGAGSDALTRYPRTGDFITNGSARQGEVGSTSSLTIQSSIPGLAAG